MLHRWIDWFAHNGIAANLLMVLIFAGGLLTLPRLKQEVFPEFSSDRILTTVEYRGAAPEEVEEGVCVRIEEAVYGLAGIKRITSNAREGMGTVNIELLPGTDTAVLLDQVKARVDAIDTFPEETEQPVVEELTLRRQVIDVAVSGKTDERSLRLVAERVRDEISALPGISLVKLANARPYEVSIEVSEEALRRHGLTFADVALAVRRSSLDLPGGSIKTRGGEILLRTKGQAYRGDEFELLTLISRRDGTRLLLSDVATVIDAFEDTEQESYFDGERAILLQVFRVGDQSALEIAATVKEYVAAASTRVPHGISLTTWQDDAAILESRLGLLVNNGLMGLAFVCILLALFLRPALAFWVALGIPLSFLGSVWLLPALDISVNLISLFAFIIVLGIVVDDAIVVGENVHAEMERGKSALEAAITGTRAVSVPVVFAILTTVAAFGPLLTVPGNTGKIMKVIPGIVIATLLFSLIESLLILPTHLSHLRNRPEPGAIGALWNRFQSLVTGGLKLLVRRVYRPSLDFCLRWRYLTLAVGIVTLIVTVGIVASGRLKFVFFPPVDADNVVGFVTMPQGTDVETTRAAVKKMEAAAFRVRQELIDAGGRGRFGEGGGGNGSRDRDRDSGGVGDGHGIVGDRRDAYRHVVSSIGGQPYREAQSLRRGQSVNFSGSHLGEVNIELAAAETRGVTSTTIARRWREALESIPDAIEVAFTSSLFSTGEAINIQLSSADVDHLQSAAAELKERLAGYPGVTDIADSFRAGKRELKLRLKPEAEPLGLSLADLAQQVRQGFYGEEVQRIQRGRDDVRVMVRYPEAERRSLAGLETMRVRTARGAEVPFSTVAAAELGRGYAAIERADRRRTVNVTADVDQALANANEILAELRSGFLSELSARYPGLSFTLEGEQREQAETFGGLKSGFALALVIIYALLAIPFRSYFQPFIVMSAIPFGVVGVVWGHLIMGLPLTLLSLFGLVALTGVVVNDSLIMVDFINRARAQHARLLDAVRQAGVARFRPIILTSVTTFAGLSPLLFERSMQAQFLKPMAASLGFGVLFATAVTLILVPVGYLVLYDIGRVFGWARTEERENELQRNA